MANKFVLHLDLGETVRQLIRIISHRSVCIIRKYQTTVNLIALTSQYRGWQGVENHQHESKEQMAKLNF